MASAAAAASSLLASSAANSSTSVLYNPLRIPLSISYSSSRRRRPLWRVCRVSATTLREKDEKVRVEESFRVENFATDEGVSAAPPGRVERWAIQLEQSVNVLLTELVIKIIDKFYHDRDYARFFVLETIARVPYFAFISVLHMYESFGWWRRADYLKVHFAESWNELHHLLIMEELGGNAFWLDRFVAQHIAIFYYFMTVIMYTVSPRMAYHFAECVERHAYATYDKFIKLKEGGSMELKKQENKELKAENDLMVAPIRGEQEEELKKLPAPEVAIKYYMNEDLYLFDEFQTHRVPQTRRPKIENLYDVFVNIRDDEAEHFKTMKTCQTHGNLRSPHSDHFDSCEEDSGCAVPQADCEGILDCIRKSLTRRK